MYKIIGELESLGDSGESISRILSRRNIHKKTFDADTVKKLDDMVSAVDNAYEAMINNLRNHLRDSEIEEIEGNNKNYHTSVYYMDIVNELEKMGDFLINISQDLERAFNR